MGVNHATPSWVKWFYTSRQRWTRALELKSFQPEHNWPGLAQDFDDAAERCKELAAFIRSARRNECGEGKDEGADCANSATDR